MASVFSTILRNINRSKNAKLNILCMNYDEPLQVALAATGHNFFFIHHNSLRSWDQRIRPIPENCCMLAGNDIPNQIKQDTEFDLILCQDRIDQYQILSQIAKQLCCPILMADYKLSKLDMNPLHVESLMYQVYNMNIFDSEFLANSWGTDGEESEVQIVPHGIDTNFFEGWRGGDEKILTIVRFYQQRNDITGFSLWQQVTKGLPINPWGESPGLSKSIDTMIHLRTLYQNASVFLNTSQWQACPMALLEAMAVGCPIVTTATTIIPDIIEHGVNGYITNDRTEMRSYLEKILADQDLGKTLGQNARKTIIDKFNLSLFVTKWNEIFMENIDKPCCLVALKE